MNRLGKYSFLALATTMILGSVPNSSISFSQAVSTNQSVTQVQKNYRNSDIKVFASTRTEVTIVFDQAHLLDLTTLKDIENYKSDTLKFYDILIVENVIEDNVKLTLLTDAMMELSFYKIDISNIKQKNGIACETFSKGDYISHKDFIALFNASGQFIHNEITIDKDESVAETINTKETKKAIQTDKSNENSKPIDNPDSIKETNDEDKTTATRETGSDITAPKVKKIAGITVDTLEIIFKDDGGFDMLCLWDVSNYDINSNIEVINVLTVDITENGSLATIVLKTDNFKKSVMHKITIRNIKDSVGNILAENTYPFAPRLVKE